MKTFELTTFENSNLFELVILNKNNKQTHRITFIAERVIQEKSTIPTTGLLTNKKLVKGKVTEFIETKK